MNKRFTAEEANKLLKETIITNNMRYFNNNSTLFKNVYDIIKKEIKRGNSSVSIPWTGDFSDFRMVMMEDGFICEKKSGHTDVMIIAW